MAEATEQVVPPVEEPQTPEATEAPEAPETPELATVPEPQGDDDDGEPGGDDPQAVRARKEYRLRKRTEQMLEQERLARVRNEERAKVLEEQAKRQPETKPEPVYTIAQVNAAVEAGTITRQQADQYIEETIIPARIEARLKAREEKQSHNTPIQQAQAGIDAYKEIIPDLGTNVNDPRYVQAGREYHSLVAQGHPADARTELLALKLSYGNLDTLKKRANFTRTPRAIPNDAGGGNGNRPTTKDWTAAPAHMIEFWNRTLTTEADRKKEFEYWQRNQEAKKR